MASTTQQQLESLAQMHRDEMATLAKMMHPGGPQNDWGKLVMPLVIAICVFYVTGTLKTTENTSISVPVITEKLNSIQASILKLEGQLHAEQTEHKGQMKAIEDRVRSLEMSIYKSDGSK
jgi:hypothetical protein